MGIIDRITKKKTSTATDVAGDVNAEEKADTKKVTKTSAKAAPKKRAVASKKEVSSDVVAAPTMTGGNSWRVLLTPRVSEKAAFLAAKGTYVFNVPLSANKVEVRKAVESLYKVHVVSVATVRGMGKMVARGRIRGQRSDWKKALVTLKKGEKIDLHQGV